MTIPDYLIIGILGRLGVAAFSFYLASMIFSTRRGSVSDKYLSLVLFVWGVAEVLDAVRYALELTFLPFYLSRGAWIVSLVVEILAVYHIRRERRSQSVRQETLIDRQEHAVERQEQVTERLESNLTERGTP